MISDDNLIKAKLHAPRLPTDFVVRGGIDKKLKEKTEASIILFSAPSGYGKSTTVIDWLQSTGALYCWVSLDENDNITKKFVQYLVLAIQGVVPDFGGEINQITKSTQDISARDYVVLFSNALASLDQNLYLVLDDYHLIRNKEIHDFIINLFKFIQPHLKLVITSRKDPPFPLSTWRMKNMLIEIRVRDLTFDSNEINQFLHNQQIAVPLNDTVEEIGKITEGWITGLRLLSVSGRDRNQVMDQSSGESMKSTKVLIELIQEMIQNQEPEFRDAILKMSVVDEFNQDLFHLITAPNPEVPEKELKFKDFVDELLRSNLFLIPLDDRHDWFRFHHLFQDLLKQTYLKTCTNEDIQDLYGKLATWHEENDQFEKSIKLLLKLDRKSEAIDLFRKYRPKIFEKSEWQVLERLLGLFDQYKIDDSFVLGLSNAWLHIYKGDIQSMMPMLPDLEGQCLEAGLMEGKQGHYLGEIHVLKAFARYNFDIDMMVCLDHASTALNLLSEDNLYATGLAWVFYGGALQALGKSNVARREVLARLDVTKSEIVRSNMYLILCYVHWMDGNMQELSDVSSALISLGRSNGLKEAEANGYYFSGCANFSRNNREEALEDFQRLYDLRHFTIMVHRFFGTAALAFLNLDNDSDQTHGLLKEMRLNAMERGGVQFIGFVQAISATVNWMESNSPESLKWAMETPHLPMLPMSNFTSNPILQSYILASSGKRIHAKKAIEILDDCELFLKKYNNLNFLTQTHVLRALTFLNLDKRELAEKEFKRALKLAVPRGLANTFLAFGHKEMLNLLENVSTSAAEQEFLEEILDSLLLKKQKGMSLLSKRELEILEYLRVNLSNKEIGANLFISESTVKRHVANIYKKLDVHNRRQVLEKARKLSL